MLILIISILDLLNGSMLVSLFLGDGGIAKQVVLKQAFFFHKWRFPNLYWNPGLLSLIGDQALKVLVKMVSEDSK